MFPLRTANPLPDSGIHLSFRFPAELIDPRKPRQNKGKRKYLSRRPYRAQSSRISVVAARKGWRRRKRLECSRRRVETPFADWAHWVVRVLIKWGIGALLMKENVLRMTDYETCFSKKMDVFLWRVGVCVKNIRCLKVWALTKSVLGLIWYGSISSHLHWNINEYFTSWKVLNENHQMRYTKIQPMFVYKIFSFKHRLHVCMLNRYSNIHLLLMILLYCTVRIIQWLHK